MTWRESRKTDDLADAPDKILSAAFAYLEPKENTLNRNCARNCSTAALMKLLLLQC